MGRKRCTPEQAITILREAEVLQSQSDKMEDVCRKLGISCTDLWLLLCFQEFSRIPNI
jgi:hypothetical protein